MANDTIEGEMPELLKAILAKDPSVFKGGALPPPYTDHTGNTSEVDRVNMLCSAVCVSSISGPLLTLTGVPR